jgi:hypothetical protein
MGTFWIDIVFTIIACRHALEKALTFDYSAIYTSAVW